MEVLGMGGRWHVLVGKFGVYYIGHLMLSLGTSVIRSVNTFSTLTMSRFPITNLFNTFDLQILAYDEDKIDSQEVVNYCEARCRVALQEIMKHNDADQEWMLKMLYRELVPSRTST